MIRVVTKTTPLSMKNAGGLTLIEVMIVVALIAILAVTAAPLTGSWIAQSQITEAESNMVEAVGRAKRYAIRNKAAVTGLTATSLICVSNNQVSVRERISSGTLACDVTSNTYQHWSAGLPSEIEINSIVTASGTTTIAAFACSCFDKRGIPTDIDCSNACVETSYFQFKRGALAEIKSYVE